MNIKSKMYKKLLKYVVTGCLALIAALIAFHFMPLPFAINENPQDGEMKPFGEILPTDPIETCASDISNYGKYAQINLSLFLATYNRTNTSHYTMQAYVTDGNEEFILDREVFTSSDVQDNSYRSFSFPAMSRIPGKLCFTVSTSDASAGNAITVWLNGEGNPVYEIVTWLPLSEGLSHLAGRNVFGLGRGALLGIFFAYLFAQSWLIFYLISLIREREKDAKPAHRERTGQGRV